MADRYTLDGFVITKMEPTGAPHAGADSGRLFINYCLYLIFVEGLPL